MKEYGTDRSWPLARGSGLTVLVTALFWVTAVLLWSFRPNLATGLFLFVATLVWLLILYFFRDPNRLVLNEPGLVVGPGDGKVVEIVQEEETAYLQTTTVRISLFLSLTDVHVQRAPLGGRVALVDHQPGKFVQAFKPEASQVNEFIGMVIETEYGRVLIKQIAGVLARRCVNYAQSGDKLITGQRFGLIKFGSRLDLFLPPHAKLLISVGDQIHGGLTPIAQL